MSHFVVWTITDKDMANNKIDSILAPYDENLRVDEYDEKCNCNISEKRIQATKLVEKQFGKTQDEIRTYAKEQCDIIFGNGKDIELESKEGCEKYSKWQNNVDELWKKLTGPFYDAIDDTVKKLDIPFKSDCPDCHGTGIYQTTYNPKSKWDWYIVGGRWDGYLDEFVKPIQSNTYNTSDVKKVLCEKMIPFGIVNESGEWIERGNMGWWGIVSNETDKEEWFNIVKNELEKASENSVITVIDCHI